MANCLTQGHCWHDEPYILTSNPPQQPQKCCHCGESRICPRPTELFHVKHGPFLKPSIDWWKGDPTCGGIAENYQAKRNNDGC